MAVINGDTRCASDVPDERDGGVPWARENQDVWDEGLRQMFESGERLLDADQSSSEASRRGARHAGSAAVPEETPWEQVQGWAESLPIVASQMFDHDLLDAEQEKILAERIQKGMRASNDSPTDATRSGRRQIREGQEALDIMVRSNLRLVRSIARTYRSDLAEEDVITFGVLGLMRAGVKFDPERARFSTYATWWIRQSIRRGIDDTERPIRIPVHAMDALRSSWRVSGEMESTLGRPPSRKEVATECGKDPATLAWLELVAQRPLSMDDCLASGDRDQTASDWWTILSDAELAGADLFVEADERMCGEGVVAALEDFVIDARSGLPCGDSPRSIERGVQMLRYRVGLVDGEPWTLDHIGNEFGLTRERVRQIIKGLAENPELRRRLAAAADIELIGEMPEPPSRSGRGKNRAKRAHTEARRTKKSKRPLRSDRDHPIASRREVGDEVVVLRGDGDRIER